MENDEIKALPLEFFTRAKELKIEKITLNFSGGSDEGYLNVYFYGDAETIYTIEGENLNREIEEWANNAYDYSGAGEGYDYGDDICYDLKKNKVFFSEWYYSRHDGPEKEIELKIDETA